jgi:hypothetical protein
MTIIVTTTIPNVPFSKIETKVMNETDLEKAIKFVKSFFPAPERQWSARIA